ncbi:MAG: hypothetical protein Q4E77_07795, partial [Conchiformibius sp.]|nr:hypothetical protein [Conchiformibius sp.]
MSAYTLKITAKGQSSAVKLPLGKTQTILADENTQYQILDADGKLLSQPRVEENLGDLWVFLDEDNVPELILQNYGEQYPIRDVQQ